MLRRWTGGMQVRGLRETLIDGEYHVEETADDMADYWGVYLEQEDGKHLHAIDVVNREDAETTVQLLSGLRAEFRATLLHCRDSAKRLIRHTHETENQLVDIANTITDLLTEFEE